MPTITLWNYGGGVLNNVSQMTAQLSNEEHRHKRVIQVQKGVPVDLLIGTDPAATLGVPLLTVQTGDLGCNRPPEWQEVDPLRGRATPVHTPAPKSYGSGISCSWGAT